MKYSYKIRMCVTDIEGCDALEVECIIPNAHSFSEALIIAERNLTYKQRIIEVLDIKKGDYNV